VKEAVYFEDETAFLMSPGGSASGAPSRPGSKTVVLTRARLREILDERGFYHSLAVAPEEPEA
jgi:hypothetical protein